MFRVFLAAISIVIGLCSTTRADLIIELSGNGNFARGYLDTSANTFTIEASSLVISNVSTKRPINDLVLHAIDADISTSTTWDIPVNVTLSQISTAMASSRKMFLVAGNNANYSWTPSGFVHSSYTAGWGGSVISRGTQFESIDNGTINGFGRFPFGTNGSNSVVFFSSSATTVTGVPEPSSLILVGLAAMRLCFIRYRRQ